MKKIWLENKECCITIDGKTYKPTGREQQIKDIAHLEFPLAFDDCTSHWIYEYEEKCKENDGYFLVGDEGYPQLEVKGNPPHTIIVKLAEE